MTDLTSTTEQPPLTYTKSIGLLGSISLTGNGPLTLGDLQRVLETERIDPSWQVRVLSNDRTETYMGREKQPSWSIRAMPIRTDSKDPA